MTPKEYLKGKRVLVAGLGLFGGGEASTKWLLKQGAQVTVTDLKTVKELEPTLKKFTPIQKKKIHFVLGRHRKSDFKNADMVVVNPGMPRESEYLKIARENGAKFENVASLLFRFLENPSIGVTGTRGKSTTTSYITEFLKKRNKKATLLGSSEAPLLEDFDDLSKNREAPVVVELSSWQLELLPESKRVLHVAVITNLYRDHQNRYKNMKAYAKAKANIFKYQTKDDFLVLNHDNEWTEYFLEQKPKAQVYFFSTKPLPKKKEGIYLSRADTLWLRINGHEKKLFSLDDFKEKYGRHNMENLLTAYLCAKLTDPKISITKKDILGLTQVSFRQEIIHEKDGFRVVNDTAATSPDATIAAVERFAVGKKEETYLITGGTDKNLDYTELAHTIKKRIKENNLFLLEGSGTKKLVVELERVSYFKKEPQVFGTLSECVEASKERLEKRKKGTLLFSPAGASFEKFTNEIERGKEFNKLVKKYFS